MARRRACKLNRAGFSLQEVLVVVAIGLIVTAVALPSMSNAIANMKLRASMTSVSGLLQNTRSMAVKENTIKTACQQACPTGVISFGSLADPASEVSKQHRDPRRYDLLHDLGTRPRNAFLVRIKNPNPELSSK